MKKTQDILLKKQNNSLRKQKSIVYLASDPNGKKYVGITEQTFQVRIKEHIRHHRTAFEKAIDEIGQDNFEWMILEKNLSREELIKKEKYYIKEYKTKIPHGYNMTSGGKGTQDFKYSEESKELQSKIKTEHYKNPKNRAKVSKGVHLAHALDPGLSKNHSKLMKQRFDKTTKEGKKRRLDAAKKQSDYIKADEENHVKHIIAHGGKPFFVIKEDKVVGVFLGQSECARRLDLNVSHINRVLKGERKTHKGYTFKYIGVGRMLDEV